MTAWKDGHKHLDRTRLARGRVNYFKLVSGIVDIHLVSRKMFDVSCDVVRLKTVLAYIQTEGRMQITVGMRLTVKSTPSSMHSFWEVSRDFAPGKFVLTTVDTIFREDDFARYVEAWENDADGCDGDMAVTPFIDDEKPLYVATDADNRITGFLDSFEDGVRYVSGGVYGLTSPGALDVLRRCIDGGVSRLSLIHI